MLTGTRAARDGRPTGKWATGETFQDSLIEQKRFFFSDGFIAGRAHSQGIGFFFDRPEACAPVYYHLW